jgi:hypothetical protein
MLPQDAELPLIWDRPRVLDLVARALPARLDDALAPFLKGMRRRLGRCRAAVWMDNIPFCAHSCHLE